MKVFRLDFLGYHPFISWCQTFLSRCQGILSGCQGIPRSFLLNFSRCQGILTRCQTLLLAATLAACGGSGPAGETASDPVGPAPWLVDVAADAGVDFEHSRGRETRYEFPEIMGGGAAWLDADGDGDLDLYVVDSGDLDGPAPELANRLYRNVSEPGSLRFEEVPGAAGAADTGYGMGAAAGDVDGDGDLDLYVTNYGANVLYLNEGAGGEARLRDVTREAGVGAPGWSASAAFVDVDGDADLDLYVVDYLHWTREREIECFTGAGERDYCGPAKYGTPARDVLYRNDSAPGEVRFTDVSLEAGLGEAFGYGLGVVAGDFDGDGRIDLYVANDAVANQLWLQQPGGTFRDGALLAGAAVNLLGAAEAGMGVAAGDVDVDGDLDLFLTHLREETNTLYLNLGGTFEDATATAGLAAPSVPLTGFGTGFADLDHDGILDLVVVNGKVRDPDRTLPGDPYAERNQVYRGTGGGRFREEPGAVSSATLGASRAAALADADGDGDLDVAVVNNGGRLELYENRAEKAGGWVMLRLRDRRGADAAGALVTLTAGGRTQVRPAGTGSGYASSHDPRVHFGLGAAERIDEVTVVWPDGGRESFGPLAPNAVHELRRGDGRPGEGRPGEGRPGDGRPGEGRPGDGRRAAGG